MPIKIQIIKKVAYVALFLTALFSLSPSAAVAGLSGEAELGYVNYERDVNSARQLDGSSFRQRYSLRYDVSDRLANGRLGGYRFSLGYEWSSIYGKIKAPGDDESLDHTAGHILYNGLLVLDPKELPFRFKLYSGDMTRSVFLRDTSFVRGVQLSDAAMITPGLDTAIIDGTHIRSGARMELGVKDSMSNHYNSVFNSLPMITVDYSDEINRDLKSINPVNSRLKKLAIASLNKKDNWVQFRSTRYDDYIDSNQNFEESQFLIGTVDEAMQRKWVRFSNWIQISADSSFTKRTDSVNSSETYDVNLFGIASRSKWEARTFNSFSRIIDINGLKYDTRLPLYISGVWGMETDWRARFSSEQIKYARSSQSAGLIPDSTENLASLRVDTFKRAPFTLAQEFLIDSFKNGSDNNLLLQGSIETASTRRFSSKFGLFASYKVRSLTSDNASSSSALSHDIAARAVYTPISAVKAELDETITLASGTGTNLSPPSVSGPNSGITQLSNIQLPSNSYSRYLTTARVDWEPAARLRLALIYENETIVAENRESIFSNRYGTNLDYTLKSLMVRLNANYTTTDTDTTSSSDFNVDGSATYTPNRYMDAQVRYNIRHSTDFAGGRTTSSDLKQNANYYFYQVSGIARRILELNETLEYTKLDAGNDDNRLSRSLAFGARYYPLNRVYLAARIKYSLIDQPQHDEQLVYNGTIGFNFQKMQATIDYSYGDQTGTERRTEKRFEANLKKFF